MTGFQKHYQKWTGCTKCPLHKCRVNVVIARGSVPCDVMFIGEAPGESEDVTGQPFIGPAGKRLDHIIHRTELGSLTYAITNLVCCIPLGDDKKVTKPDHDEIMACAPRLWEFVKLCSPKLIVCLGALAEEYLMWQGKAGSILPEYQGKYVALVHPSAIIQANDAHKELMTRRAVVKLANAVREIS